MRYLGIDYGEKRIGLAISDEEEKMAFPHAVLQNGGSTISDIMELCGVNKIKTVVLGESRNYKGEENSIMQKAHEFADDLEANGLKVIFEAEVLTTMQAERIQGKKDDIDASAAAIILQSFLDRQKFAKNDPKDKGENDEYRQKL